MNKRGEVVEMEVIMIVLTIVFFSSVCLFVVNASTSVSFYEQNYAKKIALFIEKSEPFMNLEIPIKELIEIAEENNANLDEIISIDNENNFVRVSLSFESQKNNLGFSQSFISNCNILFYIDKNKELLILNVEK